ncbi:MAG: heavy-metal-associated domain-containing protein [Firmicutes bacterium]|nr:heavy-metal-associated domain-containing protein [Bacillota bacterium]
MPENITLTIGGMSCEHCQRRIEKALQNLAGVEDVQVNLEAKTAQVQFDPAIINVEKIKAAVIDSGYEVEGEQKK